MPNIVTTFVTVVGSNADIATFVTRHLVPRRGGVSFDLDTVVSVPAALEGLRDSTYADLAFYALSRPPSAAMRAAHPLDGYGMVPRRVRTPDDLHAWLEQNRPEALVEGARRVSAFEATGYEDRHEWIERHWGASNNTLATTVLHKADGALTFTFETAWTFPAPIFEALAVSYPTLFLRVAAYDAEGGFAVEGECNGGGITIREVHPTPDWCASLPRSGRKSADLTRVPNEVTS